MSGQETLLACLEFDYGFKALEEREELKRSRRLYESHLESLLFQVADKYKTTTDFLWNEWQNWCVGQLMGW